MSALFLVADDPKFNAQVPATISLSTSQRHPEAALFDV